MRFTRVLILIWVALTPIALSSAASAQVAVGVSIEVAPPLLPVYDQPPMPDVGYIWTPGYWAYGPEGYYWVPGTWVLPPAVGLLWTPPYWGWSDGVYVLHAGYWGPHVGFYGGINYGFGYEGVGYEGGYWEHGVFNYNQTVNNFGGVNVTNVYDKTVINSTSVTNVSFNGGTGGTTAQPSAEQVAAAREQHTPPTPLQAQHEHVSSTNHALLASVNHGQPAIAATPRPGELNAHGVVGTRDATGGTHSPGTMHAPGEPGPQHAVNPATTLHSPGPHTGGVPPHQTNATPQHALGNVNTPHVRACGFYSWVALMPSIPTGGLTPSSSGPGASRRTGRRGSRKCLCGPPFHLAHPNMLPPVPHQRRFPAPYDDVMREGAAR